MVGMKKLVSAAKRFEALKKTILMNMGFTLFVKTLYVFSHCIVKINQLFHSIKYQIFGWRVLEKIEKKCAKNS